MPEYTEQIIDRELRVSLYDDDSFASAEYRKRVQVLRDGEPAGKPEWQPAPITQEALQILLGEASVTQRDHVTRVEAQCLQMRADHAAELAALKQAHAEALASAEAARQQVIAEANATIQEQNTAAAALRSQNAQLAARVQELESLIAAEPT